MDFGTVITAMLTPMDTNGAVDYDKAQLLADYLLNNGSDALVISGTTGEAPTLSKDEKLKLFSAIHEVTKGRAPMIAGTSTYDTAASIELSKKAESLGADALLAVTPYYNKPPQEGVYRHFKAIAESVSVPIILYNVPSRTNVNLLPETVTRLAEIDNIVALKEASGDLDQVAKIRKVTPADFILYSGDDGLTLPMLKLGAKGIISVAGHMVGNQIKEMINCFERGDIAQAEQLHQRYLPVFQKIFICANPIPLKYCMDKMGLPAGPCRLPLCEADIAAQTELNALLKEFALA